MINTHGEQVVDSWAFNGDDLSELMSMEHTRAHTLRLVPRVGGILRTNRRRPILTLVEDTSGGVHDILIAACDRYRYAFLGVEGHHDNCADNFDGGAGRTRPQGVACAKPLQSVHEHTLEPRRWASLRRTIQAAARQLREVSRGNECRGRLLGVSARFLPINGRARQPVEAHFRIA